MLFYANKQKFSFYGLRSNLSKFIKKSMSVDSREKAEFVKAKEMYFFQFKMTIWRSPYTGQLSQGRFNN